MDQRIPPEVRSLVEDYSSRLQKELPGRIKALYLEGSIALGGFNPRSSDIDFAAISISEITSDDVNKILNIHEELKQCYPARKISGWYYQPEDLQNNGVPHQPMLYLHERKLHQSVQFGLSLVTWWILNHHGVTIFGPPAQSLGIPVDVEDLLVKQMEILNTYWARWPKRPGRFLALFTDWGIQWMVLGILRQYYTLNEQGITSKDRAGEYALAYLPERWHKIIREALAVRENPKRTLYRSRIQRAADALRFHRFIIDLCNEIYNKNGYLDSLNRKTFF